MNFVQLAECDMKGTIKKKSSQISFSEMKLKLAIHALDISLYINCVFCFGRIRTLVAMATYIFDRLIMRKVQIDNFSASTGIFGFYFTKMLIK